MNELFWKRLANLVSVKSILTIVTTVVFAALALNQAITPDKFMDVFKIIVVFYFGTQAGKLDK